MSLLSMMKDLPKETKVNIQETLGAPENIEDVLMERIEEPKEKRPKREKPKQEEETHVEEKPDIKDEEDDEKPEVKGYQSRTKKQYEKELETERQERQRERERADRLEQALLSGRTPEKREQVPERVAVPDPRQDPDGYVKHMLEEAASSGKNAQQTAQKIQNELTLMRAKDEVRSMEDDYSREQPDYKAALKFTMDRDVAIQKRVNPNVSEKQIRDQLQHQYMTQLARLQQAGVDPLATYYQNMVDYGYSPKSKEDEDEADKDERKTFDSVRKNKANSATSLTAGGRSSSKPAASAPNRMKLSEFAKLSKSEKDETFRDKRRS